MPFFGPIIQLTFGTPHPHILSFIKKKIYFRYKEGSMYIKRERGGVSMMSWIIWGKSFLLCVRLVPGWSVNSQKTEKDLVFQKVLGGMGEKRKGEFLPPIQSKRLGLCFDVFLFPRVLGKYPLATFGFGNGHFAVGVLSMNALVIIT